VLVPGLAGWRRERMPSYPDVPYFTLPPDWVCEVLSASTRRTDLVEKRDIYGAAGVGPLWFVDPVARTLEAFALGDGRWTLVTALRDDAEVRVPPFEAVGFPLSALWTG
jgi:Uma2 family endonuclease